MFAGILALQGRSRVLCLSAKPGILALQLIYMSFINNALIQRSTLSCSLVDTEYRSTLSRILKTSKNTLFMLACSSLCLLAASRGGRRCARRRARWHRVCRGDLES